MDKIATILCFPFLLLTAVGFGYGIRPVIEPAPAWMRSAALIYQSRINDDATVSVMADGGVEFGAQYDRTTEAKKLVEMARQMQRRGEILDCHETSYRQPENGLMQVFPGSADAPPPRMEWRQ